MAEFDFVTKKTKTNAGEFLPPRFPSRIPARRSSYIHQPTMTDDTTLIRAAQGGDKEAFAALLRAHYHSMYKMAYKWCGEREMAQDVVQDACIKVARHLRGFRFQASFTSWLYRIVINTAKDQRKREACFAPLPERELTTPPPDEQQHARHLLRRVHALPEREKTALLLVFGEGMTHREAAFAMRCREGTVSAYVHQARKRLAALVAENRVAEQAHG